MKKAEFKWSPLSDRQQKIMTWWTESSPVRDYEGVIADGAIRSGKTISMGFSFVQWAMTSFNGQAFIMAGKTVGTLRRNVIKTLMKQLRMQKYTVKEHRGQENLLIVRKGNVTNYFYEFGGNNEASQDSVQGLTAAGAFFDEVALMPQSFVEQSTGRCSVDGSKWWFNCNPMGPQHWFYAEWILKCRERKILYLHFTMADNLTLTARIRQRYESQYSGIFYRRYILGEWCMAEGLIYDMFDSKAHVMHKEPETEGDYYVSSDFGIQNATVFLLWRKERGTDRWICLREYYYSGRDNHVQKTISELCDGLESILPRDDGGRIIEPKQVIVDPSASALIAEIRKRGMHVRSANNDVINGISNVSTMLRQQRLAFMDCCKNTIQEFGVYIWDSKAADRGEDAPVKTNDHAMDAIRYFVNTLGLVKIKQQYISAFR